MKQPHQSLLILLLLLCCLPGSAIHEGPTAHGAGVCLGCGRRGGHVSVLTWRCHRSPRLHCISITCVNDPASRTSGQCSGHLGPPSARHVHPSVWHVEAHEVHPRVCLLPCTCCCPLYIVFKMHGESGNMNHFLITFSMKAEVLIMPTH